MATQQDNAADSELGFLTYPTLFTQLTHSNSVSVTYSMADGSRSVVSFSRNEIKEIREYFRAWIGDIVNPAPYGVLDSPEIGRTARAFYWIQAGRTAPALGIRVASFCTALESLFATSPLELAHQLAERISVFLSDESGEREQIYRKVKRAYNLRSKVVHGDVLKDSKTPELVDVSLECDDLLRRAILKAVYDEGARSALDGGNDSLDRYFLGLLFG